MFYFYNVGFDFQVSIETLLPEFSPEPRLLEASEWSIRIEVIVAVYVDMPCLQFSRYGGVGLNVLSLNSRSKPVLRIIRALNYLVVGRVLENGHHGSEDLFARDSHVIPHVAENRGLDEVPLVPPPLSAQK